MIQHLPSLDGMDALKTLSLINAHALKTLPDLDVYEDLALRYVEDVIVCLFAVEFGVFW